MKIIIAGAGAVGSHLAALLTNENHDIVLIDPDAEWTVEDDFASKAHNTPFIGRKLTGKVIMTIASGRIVYGK